MNLRPKKIGSEAAGSGKTGWDFAAGVVNSWPALISAIALFVAIPTAVHFKSEPGTEISLFWGLAKYSKAKALPPEVHPSHYLLPKQQELLVNRPEPILDGTINVRLMRDGRKEILRVGGANVTVIRVRGVDKWGNQISFAANNERKTIDVVGTVACRLEVQYQGLLFLVSIEQTEANQGHSVTVNQISKPSGQLEHVFSQ